MLSKCNLSRYHLLDNINRLYQMSSCMSLYRISPLIGNVDQTTRIDPQHPPCCNFLDIPLWTMADNDDNAMSEDEYDDNLLSDNENNPDEDEEDLPENHGKMVAFHAAIKTVLVRQLEKMHGEVRETGRLVVIGVEVMMTENDLK